MPHTTPPKVVIYTDGGARNNPGPAGIGAVIKQGEEVLAEVSEYIGEQTNNWAEYEAVVQALQKAKEIGLAGAAIEFRLDSMLVAEQLMGRWKIKEPTLKPQAAKVHALLADFGKVLFKHIPREQNAEADRLVNEAVDQELEKRV